MASGGVLTRASRQHIVDDYTLRGAGLRLGRRRGEDVKKTALVSGIVVAGAAAALVIGLRAAGKADKGGFLGPATLLADVNLLLQILLVLGVTFGMVLARRGRIEAHRVNQTVWVLVNAALVALIMVGSMSTFKLAHLRDLANLGNFVIVLHAAVGTLTLGAALWLVLQMNDILPANWHIRRWKRLMQATLAGYWLMALLGIALYYLWYAE
jgi:hypothetical protein